MKPLRHMWFLFVLLLVGCSKVSDEMSFEVPMGEAKIMGVEAPKQDQKVRVEFTSDEPINVVTLLDEDAGEAAEQAVMSDTKPEKALGGELKASSGSYEVSVPKGKAFQIITAPAGGKTAKVTVKVNSL